MFQRGFNGSTCTCTHCFTLHSFSTQIVKILNQKQIQNKN